MVVLADNGVETDILAGGGRFGLVTLHRPSNVDQQGSLAEALEIPANTAASRYRYGLEELRKTLGGQKLIESADDSMRSSAEGFVQGPAISKRRRLVSR
jgi:hypothetical protein